MNFRGGRSRMEPEPWKGVAAGIAGGLVASWVMNRMWGVMSKAAEAVAGSETKRNNGPRSEQQEDPTVKTADVVARGVANKQLTKNEKKTGGVVVHYAFGALVGGLYGAAAEYLPAVKSAFGMPYGAMVWAGADEMALPLLGLSGKPSDYPLSRHISGLGSHLVYGTTLEAARWVIRERL